MTHKQIMKISKSAKQLTQKKQVFVMSRPTNHGRIRVPLTCPIFK